MTMLAISLMVFSTVLLIVSVYYIGTSTRHKERMALIERGEDVKKIFDNRQTLDIIKFGMAFIGGGIGFLVGAWLEDARYFNSDIEMPLYHAPIFVCVGLSLILFYRFYGKKYRNPE